jgi:hypothetical protein
MSNTSQKGITAARYFDMAFSGNNIQHNRNIGPVPIRMTLRERDRATIPLSVKKLINLIHAKQRTSVRNIANHGLESIYSFPLMNRFKSRS